MSGDSSAHGGHDLADFRLSDMIACSAAIRRLGDGCTTMEQTSGNIVRWLHHNLRCRDGARCAALIRIFKTAPLGALDERRRRFAGEIADRSLGDRVTCLALLASAGREPAWNDAYASKGHLAIPLPSTDAVARLPMVAQLLYQLGADVDAVVAPDGDLFVDRAEMLYNVFHVPAAPGSPHVPSQDDFVRSFGIRSVIGFGGAFSRGDFFAVIIFASVPVTRETAGMFRTLAMSAKLALLPFVDSVFDGRAVEDARVTRGSPS